MSLIDGIRIAREEELKQQSMKIAIDNTKKELGKAFHEVEKILPDQLDNDKVWFYFNGYAPIRGYIFKDLVFYKVN